MATLATKVKHIGILVGFGVGGYQIMEVTKMSDSESSVLKVLVSYFFTNRGERRRRLPAARVTK